MYWFSISFTSFSACLISSCFCSGMRMSLTPNEIPARVAIVKPACISLSAKITVSRSPQRRKAALMRREISFFLSGLLSSSKGSPGGRISDRSERPMVVS